MSEVAYSFYGDADLDVSEVDCDLDDVAMTMWNGETRRGLLTPLAQVMGVDEIEVFDDVYVILAVNVNMKPVTWDGIRDASGRDNAIKQFIRCLNDGHNSEKISMETASLLKCRSLLEIDGDMLLYRGRPVVPVAMREQVLQTLHAAHQGVTWMVARAEESMFWPGMTNAIRMMRESCNSCRKYAPSQSKLPSWDPITPEYPFQHLCADYLEYGGIWGIQLWSCGRLFLQLV